MSLRAFHVVFVASRKPQTLGLLRPASVHARTRVVPSDPGRDQTLGAS